MEPEQQNVRAGHCCGATQPHDPTHMHRVPELGALRFVGSICPKAS